MLTETTLPLTSDELASLESLLPFASEQELLELRRLTGMTDRQLAESSLHEFVVQAWPIVEPEAKFVDGKHIQGICLHLEALTNDLMKNLLVNLPPGHCKSLLMAVFWPAWVWITKPWKRFIFFSYTQELSVRDSVKCRQLIESPWYQKNWGSRFRIMGDQNSKIKYENDKRGWRMASSVEGRGTGEHPDFIVVDDPHNAKQAESEAERAGVIEWWTGTMTSRGFIRGAKRVVIMQRLHEEDLSGYLIKSGGFEHICLPMEWEPDRMKPTSIGWMDWRTEKGQLLWPEAVTPQMLATLKGEMRELKAAGQLQQRPAPAEGGLFKRDKLQIINAAPAEFESIVRYWDKAGTLDGGDHTAGVLMGRKNKKYYVVDVVRVRLDSEKRNAVMLQVAQMDNREYGNKLVTWVEQEGGSGGKESAEITVQLLAGFRVKTERVTGEKQVRAEPFADQVDAGNVFLVEGAWNRDYIDELAVFPNGSHDDQVDGSSGAFNKIALARTFSLGIA